jgi:hypothetical protein
MIDQAEKLGARDKTLSDQSNSSADLIILRIICRFLENLIAIDKP